MAALTIERNTPQMAGAGSAVNQGLFPVAAGVKLFQGALVAYKSSLVHPGAVETGAQGCGRCEKTVDNTLGAPGAVNAIVRAGVFKFNNSPAGVDFVNAVLFNCYIVDDNTVAKTDGGATRSIAGLVRQVDADGVWVELKFS